MPSSRTVGDDTDAQPQTDQDETNSRAKLSIGAVVTTPETLECHQSRRRVRASAEDPTRRRSAVDGHVPHGAVRARWGHEHGSAGHDQPPREQPATLVVHLVKLRMRLGSASPGKWCGIA